MDTPNWGLIRSGATFESLVTTLLCFEDPTTVPLGRQGRDDGQDAKSADGKSIYQVKFHEEPSAAKAIRDAVAEARKIATYRREAGPRQEVWRDATCWVLATNATFNTRDHKRWISEVVPEFKKVGLTATYWERAKIEALLDKHPEVKRSYFEGETRVFLSLPEARDRVHAIAFHREALAAKFRGRMEELNQYRRFLGGLELVLLIHGPGGIGKTRLMIEGGDILAARTGWQVLWANLDSLAASSSWFRGLPDRRSLVLVDDPENADVLRTLVEQMRTSTARDVAWKAVVAVRSPNDPVIHALESLALKRHTKKLEVRAINTNDGTAFCRDLLDAGDLAGKGDAWLTKAADWIARHYDGFPAWIGIAAKLLVERGDLGAMPASAADLASEYLDEIVEDNKAFERQDVLRVVRWLSLLRTLNTESKETLRAIQDLAGLVDVGRLVDCLNRLVERRVVITRGARNRLLEIKPDVLTDHILREWLTAAHSFGDGERQASEDAKALLQLLTQAVDLGKMNDIRKSALRALARLEFIQRHAGEPVDLIGPLLAVVEAKAPTWGAGKQLSILEVLEILIPVRIEDVVRIAKAIHESGPPSEIRETRFGPQTTTHTDVVRALPWVLFGGAMYADSDSERKAVLRLLCDLAVAESQLGETLPHGLPSHGKRARELIVRVIEGEASFRSDFHPTAFEEARRLLSENRNGNEPKGWDVLLPIIVAPLLEVERQQMDCNDHSVTVRRYAIDPGGLEWRNRKEIKKALKDILKSRTASTAFACAAWRLLDEAHSSAHRAKGMFKKNEKGREAAAAVAADLKEDLQRCLTLVQVPGMEIEELKAARKLWDWDYQFGEDTDLKALAAQCEEAFRKNDRAAEFQSLTDREDLKLEQERAKDKGVELASSSVDEIASFAERASEYLGGPGEMHRLSSVGYALGQEAPGSSAVREFVKIGLETASDSAQFRLAVDVAASWVRQTRSSGGNAVELLCWMLEWSGEPGKIVELVRACYGTAWSQPLPEDEARLVMDQLPHFSTPDAVSTFLRIVGGMPYSGWRNFTEACQEAMEALDPEHKQDGFSSLLESLGLAICKDGDDTQLKVNDVAADWILDQLLLLPSIDDIGTQGWWRLREMLGRTKRPDLTWLVRAIQTRINREPSNDNNGRYQILPISGRLTSLIEPISPDAVPSEDTVRLVSALLAYIDRKGLLEYALPQYVHDVDPHGIVVPDLVEEKLQNKQTQADFDTFYRWTRFGGVYAENSEPWRRIARPALAVAPRFGDGDRISLMHALTDPRIQSYWSAVGEVAARFTSAVETATRSLEEEEEDVFLPYRQWRLQCAETNLQRERERIREERGD